MTLPTHALEKLIALLQDGTDLDVFNVPRLLGVSETKAEPILHLLASGRLDRTNVLILLRAMTALRENMSRSAAEVEMCWTGPPSLEVMEKSTDSVMQDMIGRAREEILIVGYRITDSGETIRRLSESMRYVDHITMIIDNDKQRVNLTSIDNAFRGITRPRIYTHKKREKEFYKVHAKVLIIDQMEMLLTSANMTHYGLTQNFEMGVRIRGRPAKDARSLIMQMIDRKYFEEMA